MPRDPKSEAVVERFTRLTGEEGAFLSDREVEAEMKAQGWPVSHERIRQYRADEWEIIQRATLRKLMAYNDWKASRSGANPSRRGTSDRAKDPPPPDGLNSEDVLP